MRSLVYWKLLMVSEHRNRRSPRAQGQGEDTDVHRMARLPARALSSSSRHKILATIPLSRELVMTL